MERYAYLQDGKNEFNSTDILCVVADAIHVGSEDWLIIMAYNHTKGKVWICPPQAGFFFVSRSRSFLEGSLASPRTPGPRGTRSLAFFGAGGRIFRAPGVRPRGTPIPA